MNAFERGLVLNKIKSLSDGERQQALYDLLGAMPERWVYETFEISRQVLAHKRAEQEAPR